MLWLLWTLVTLPLRLGFGIMRTVLRTIGFVGPGRLLAFVAGIATGMAVAPTEVGRRVEGLVRPPAPATAGADLAQRVSDELAHSPRTWHLPQPTVFADGDRIVLTGEVPHETGRGDIVRTAGAVAGVAAVENRLTLAP